MSLKLQCRHCYWLRRRQTDKKQTCEDMGKTLTSPTCPNFTPEYFGLPLKVKELVHLMGQIKDSDLPLAVYLAEVQHKINRSKRTKYLKHRVGDRVQYKRDGETFNILINHLTEEHVFGETEDGKHFTVLHENVIPENEVRKVQKVKKPKVQKVQKVKKPMPVVKKAKPVKKVRKG